MKGKRTEKKGKKKWLIVEDYLVNNGQTLVFVIYEGLKNLTFKCCMERDFNHIV